MRFLKKTILISIGALVLFGFSAKAQEDITISKLEFSGFIDLYYGYDFNKPMEKKRLPFLYNHARHNTPTVNLASIKGSYTSKRFRANLALQQGTYVEDNLEREAEALEWIQEANLGVALSAKEQIWLDVGIFPAHTGFESAISSQNPTLSRSLVAEGSPYFLTGGRLSWMGTEKWILALYIVNGWQLIEGIEGNSSPSFGSQIVFYPNQNIALNWNTFIGPSGPDENRQMRYFSNLFANLTLSDQWNMIIGFDSGFQKPGLGETENKKWFGGAWITQYIINEKWQTAARAEFYNDPGGVNAINPIGDGLKASGFSLNLDRNLGSGFLIRVEGRYLVGPANQFVKEEVLKKDNFYFLSSVSWTWN